MRYTIWVADASNLDPPVARTGGKRPPREVTLHIRVTQQAVEAIDRLAEEQQRTRSDMIRILLKRGMEAK